MKFKNKKKDLKYSENDFIFYILSNYFIKIILYRKYGKKKFRSINLTFLWMKLILKQIIKK